MFRFPSLPAVVLALTTVSMLTAPASAQNPADVVRYTNAERQRYGLRPLQYSPALTTAATSHATAMARSGQLSHSLGGSTLTTRLNQVGYSYRAAGENIAYGQRTAQEAVSSWMSSSGHRSNILSSSYTQIGVGIRQGSDGRYYYCQVFAAGR